MKPFGFVQF